MGANVGHRSKLISHLASLSVGCWTILDAPWGNRSIIFRLKYIRQLIIDAAMTAIAKDSSPSVLKQRSVGPGERGHSYYIFSCRISGNPK